MYHCIVWASLVAQSGKNLPAMQETVCNTADAGSIPELGESPGEKMATHSSILACEIPWTEEPSKLQSMGLQEPDMT